MPLTPEQRAAYGPDWPAVSREVRDRSGGRCECTGECGWIQHTLITLNRAMLGPVEQTREETRRCPAVNGRPSPLTASKVVLTVAHLDRNPGVNDRDRLKAMCQGCHLSYDRQATVESPEDPT